MKKVQTFKKNQSQKTQINQRIKSINKQREKTFNEQLIDLDTNWKSEKSISDESKKKWDWVTIF